MNDAKRQYREYLESEHWKNLKDRKKRKSPRKTCPGCALVKPLQLHHMLYRGDPENTELYDLMWLCDDCHKLFHELHGLQVPPDMRRNRMWLKAYTKKLLRAELKRRGLWTHGSFRVKPDFSSTGLKVSEFLTKRAE